MARATIYIGANTKQANSALSSTNNAVAKFGKGFAKTAKNIAKKAVAVTAAVATMAVAIGKKSVDAYIAQENAEQRLETIAKNTINATAEQIQQYKDLAKEMQKVTTLGDDVVIAGQSQIASFTTNASVVTTLTGDIADLAVATYGANVSQEQMIQSANMVGKALNGQLGAMTKSGVLVSEDLKKAFEAANNEEERAAIISQILKDNYGGLAEAAAQTAQGGLLQLKNSIGDMAEEIGAELIPAINDAVPAIKEGFTSILPDIKNVMTGLLGILSGDPLKAEQFTTGINNLVSKAVDTIVSAAPTIIDAFGSIMSGLVNAIISKQDSIAAGVTQFVQTFGTLLLENIPLIMSFGISMFTALLQGIAEMDLATLVSSGIVLIVNAFLENLEPILLAGVEIVVALIQGLTSSLPLIVDSIISVVPILVETIIVDVLPALLEAILTLIPQLITSGYDMIVGLQEGLKEAAPRLWAAAKEAIIQMMSSILMYRTKMNELGTKILTKFIDGMKEKFEAIKETAGEIKGKIKEKIDEIVTDAKEWGTHLLEGFIQGIKDKLQSLKDTIKNVANTVKDYIGFTVPDKGPLSDFDKSPLHMMEGYSKGIDKNLYLVKNSVKRVAQVTDDGMSVAPSAAGKNATAGGSISDSDYEKLAELIAKAIWRIAPDLDFNMDGRRVARIILKYLKDLDLQFG